MRLRSLSHEWKIGEALVEDRGYDGAYRMDGMTCQRRFVLYFDAYSSLIGTLRAMPRRPVEMPVLLSDIVSMSSIPEHPRSDFRCVPQGCGISRDFRRGGQDSIKPSSSPAVKRRIWLGFTRF